MSFSAQLREATAPAWDAAVGHRFVDELWSGSVPREVLTRYLVQDHQFVDAFTALMGAAVAGADRAEPRVRLARQLGLVAGPENDFFDRSLTALGVPDGDRTAPELLAPTIGFRDLMDESRVAGYPEALAVLLVAEWLYLDWATRPGADVPADPIHTEWIDLHRGPDFESWVAFLRAEFDRAGEELSPPRREEVAAMFVRAVDLELAFFDAAY
ncbi:thiaminase/transcriptional activator TenA [Pseudonocardia sediminis]|uniref:Aminopyrimidine aminohydrolase n=1 Tax=Pseudonocardia sediminis TaxID=1397368 RepID=A0A4Q7V6Y8_PSEST|nr:TenA family protein [Pseudonocardia sediminis]RZT88563.1 thiaminase/transcriptional activator TenA [Pseudonocardia sediminis]